MLLALFAALSTSPSGATEVTTFTPSRICWQELEYRASKIGIEAE